MSQSQYRILHAGNDNRNNAHIGKVGDNRTDNAHDSIEPDGDAISGASVGRREHLFEGQYVVQ